MFVIMKTNVFRTWRQECEKGHVFVVQSKYILSRRLTLGVIVEDKTSRLKDFKLVATVISQENAIRVQDWALVCPSQCFCRPRVSKINPRSLSDCYKAMKTKFECLQRNEVCQKVALPKNEKKPVESGILLWKRARKVIYPIIKQGKAAKWKEGKIRIQGAYFDET